MTDPPAPDAARTPAPDAAHLERTARVLVVGAGPCGLAVAGELLSRGVQVVVLDAAPEPGSGSRAILLWPPALEILGELGVLDEAERIGIRAQALRYHIGGGRAVRVRLDAVNAPLLLPQKHTGRLLEDALEKLGGRVERPVEVTGVTDDGDAVAVRARRPDGTELTYHAEWIIGADGVHSTVREQLGVEFTGSRFPATFLLAEGRLSGELDRTEVHYFLSPVGVLLIAPLPGDEVRLSGAVDPDTPVTEETAQRLLDERGPGGLRISELSMLTTFGSHERVAASMQVGKCFLAGDAAHVNSVVGGQGLNLGLQDARNLAWKLAGVIDGRLDPRILATYDPERRAAAEQTLRATHRMTSQAVLGPLAVRMRNASLRVLGATGILARQYPSLLAGWRIRYPDSLSIPAGAGHGPRPPRGVPRPGTRAPSWTGPLAPGGRSGFRLVSLGPAGGELALAARALADRHPDLACYEHLAGARPARHERQGFVLVRPDGFVASSGVTLAALDQAGAVLGALSMRGRG
jgi:2-polyprenyl-6-methoxyphenol hydroxylase-like FAD-dependent oxidoreductase